MIRRTGRQIYTKEIVIMRNLDTPVKQIRHKIFTEVAKVGFESKDETLIHDIEAIPYNLSLIHI